MCFPEEGSFTGLSWEGEAAGKEGVLSGRSLLWAISVSLGPQDSHSSYASLSLWKSLFSPPLPHSHFL
jgi:hypothetical protein